MPPWGKFDQKIEVSNSEEDATIWRFVDLAKFVDMFFKRRIYFRRSDLLDDSFEGMPTGPLLEYLYNSYREINEIGRAWPDSVAAANDTLIELRQSNFINSWYLSEYESAAMWPLYSKIGSGIAIQSKVKCLRRAMPSNVYIGKVIYLDYSVADEIGREDDLRSLFFIKRNYFEHEKEIRALYSKASDDPRETGHYLNIDLDQIVLSVILAPGTPTWFRESVEAVMQTVLPSVEVRGSLLDVRPAIDSSKPI